MRFPFYRQHSYAPTASWVAGRLCHRNTDDRFFATVFWLLFLWEPFGLELVSGTIFMFLNRGTLP